MKHLSFFFSVLLFSLANLCEGGPVPILLAFSCHFFLRAIGRGVGPEPKKAVST